MKIPIRLTKYTEDGVNKAYIEQMDVVTSTWSEFQWLDGVNEKEVQLFYNGLIVSGIFTEVPRRIHFDGTFYCVMYWSEADNGWKQQLAGGVVPIRYKTYEDAVLLLNNFDDTGYEHAPQPVVVILENKQV